MFRIKLVVGNTMSFTLCLCVASIRAPHNLTTQWLSCHVPNCIYLLPFLLFIVVVGRYSPSYRSGYYFLCARIKVEQLFYILFVCQVNWLHLRLGRGTQFYWPKYRILNRRQIKKKSGINNRVVRFYYTTKQLLVVNRDHGADYLRVQKRENNCMQSPSMEHEFSCSFFFS